MADPSYQDVPGEDIPLVHIKQGLDVKILAGLCHKTTGVIQTQVPLQYLDFRVQNNVEYTHIAPVEMTTGIVYVYHGSGTFGAQDVRAKEGDTILKYGHDIGKVVAPIKKGDHVHVHNVKTKKW